MTKKQKSRSSSPKNRSRNYKRNIGLECERSHPTETTGKKSEEGGLNRSPE